MITTKRNYETLFIVDAQLTDEQIQTIIDKYTQVVTDQGGEVQAAGKWDKRKLAYEIKHKREGNYILIYFTGEPAVAKELDRIFRISDEVLRHIIIRIEPQQVDTTRIEHPASIVEQAELLETVSEEEETPEEVEAETSEDVEAPVVEEAAVDEVAEAPVTEETPVEEVVSAEQTETTVETQESAVEEPKEE